MNMGTKMYRTEYVSTYSRQMNVGRLLIALYDVYGETSPEVQQHSSNHVDLFEENTVYSDKLEKDTVCVAKVNGQLIATERREDLQYVSLPNGEDNPLLGTDY